MRTALHRIGMAAPLTLLLTGCFGGEDPAGPIPPGGPDPVTPWQNQMPLLTVASPGQMAVGDSLVIIGQSFIPADRGTAMVLLSGTYFDDEGGAIPVDLQSPAVREGQRTDKLSWRLWPNVVFHPNGDRLGTFVGSVRVVNQGNDGSQLASDPLPLKIEILPSLIARLVRPVNSACQPMVEKTVEDTGFAFAVEAIGMRPGSPDAPLTFYWTFLNANWTVSMTWINTDPESLYAKAGAFVLEDQVTSGSASTVQDGGDRNFLVKVGTSLASSAGLLGQDRPKSLRTAKVPESGNGYIANVSVAAVDATGKTARLSIALDVSRLADLSYDGGMQIAERFPPVLVSDCFPSTGDLPAQVSYSEDQAESHSRSMGFNYNANAGLNIAPFPQNPWLFGINFSVGFGVEIGGSVSTNHSEGLNLSGQIMPGMYGAFYRQTTKVYRVGRIIGRNKCGQTVDLGEAILTDWLFTPELATGSSCMPASQMPPAQKFLD